MEISRISKNQEKYIQVKESIIHSTAFIATEDEKVIAVFEYRFNDFDKVEITRFCTFNECDKNEILNSFIDEIMYWNPFVKEIVCEKKKYIGIKEVFFNVGFKDGQMWTLKTQYKAEAFKILIKDIVPEQLTVEEDKYNKAMEWIDKPEDVVVCCVKIDDKIVSIDGHSRLVAASEKGFEYVYGFLEPGDTDIEFFKECLSWCEEAGVKSIADLSKRIVSVEEHKRLWVDRCQSYFSYKETE
ncbi:hypothetical protein [Clostridium oryzae]|uniref:ParB-like nuclease domain protein n=1 Tax=Clostridium oryzae TaxID=1450648 RepID=A0A1V4IM55_9CLOT|nr:hypothetical protein [Clostridium oryzae]OPJ60567.1 hypothetical protein CLORY_27430 [Clostridium oryzae]